MTIFLTAAQGILNTPVFLKLWISQCHVTIKSFLTLFSLPPGVSQQAALPAHVHFKGVAWDHEALQQQHARSVADQTVTFHLSETQTSVSGATLCWLPDHGTRWGSKNRWDRVQERSVNHFYIQKLNCREQNKQTIRGVWEILREEHNITTC